MQLSDISIHSWIQEFGIKTESGIPLDFHDHRYLYDIYADDSPNIVEMKAAQLGLSTMEIIRTMWRAMKIGLDCIYILPTFTDIKDFAGGKVNRIIDQNPILQTWVKDKDSTEQKRVGKATIYYRGSWNERQALMIAADWLVLDEFDRCRQEVLEQYESRLQHSRYGYKAIFSNPSMPDFGVDKYYQKTDQKKWHITHSCGNTYILDESCVDIKAEIYRCPKCREEITNEERRMGDWVATAEGQEGWSGYWIPLWINPLVPASKIAQYKKEKTPEYFANFVAGLPYVGTNNALNQKLLEANLTPQVNDQQGRVIIGVDTGHNIHYVLQNKQGIFYHGYIKSVAENEASPFPIHNYDPYDELEKQLIKYKNSIIISDQGGDLIGIRKLQAKYASRVFLCWFTKETKTQQIIRWGENEESGKVLVDRNRMIQMCVDELTEQRMPINGTVSEWQPYFNHWLNIYRAQEIVDEQEPAYGWRWVWKRKGPDHWCFTEGTKITTDTGDKNIQSIQIGDRVLTRKGYKRVTAVMSREAEVMQVGSLEGTPDHPIYTQQQDFKPLHTMVYADRIKVWHPNILFIKALHIADTLIQRVELKESILSPMGHLEHKDSVGYTKNYTKIITELYRKALLYTTKTIIQLTTTSVTWGYYHEQNIKDTTTQSVLKTQNIVVQTKNICSSLLRKVKQALEIGERLILGYKPFVTMDGRLYLVNPFSFSVFNVETNPKLIQDTAVSSVVLNVVESSLRGNGDESTQKRVYNFEVEDAHEYFANGILVHNCMASVYARVGIDRFPDAKATIVDGSVLEGIPTGRIFEESSVVIE